MGARKEAKTGAPPGAAPAPESGAAEQSALAALQAAFDEERVAHLATRARLEREIEALHARLAEVEAELAQSAARLRELEARQKARPR